MQHFNCQCQDNFSTLNITLIDFLREVELTLQLFFSFSGALFIPKPNTPDVEGTVFCNIKGEDNETELEYGTKPGG